MKRLVSDVWNRDFTFIAELKTRLNLSEKDKIPWKAQ